MDSDSHQSARTHRDEMKRIEDPVCSSNLTIPNVFQAERQPIHRANTRNTEEHPLKGCLRRVKEELTPSLAEVGKGLCTGLCRWTSRQAQQAAAEHQQAAVPAEELKFHVLGENAKDSQKREAVESSRPRRGNSCIGSPDAEHCPQPTNTLVFDALSEHYTTS